MNSRWGSTPRLTDWLTDRQSQCDFDFAWSSEAVEELGVMQSVEENSEGFWVAESFVVYGRLRREEFMCNICSL
jgi:hypothetical protein